MIIIFNSQTQREIFQSFYCDTFLQRITSWILQVHFYSPLYKGCAWRGVCDNELVIVLWKMSFKYTNYICPEAVNEMPKWATWSCQESERQALSRPSPREQETKADYSPQVPRALLDTCGTEFLIKVSSEITIFSFTACICGYPHHLPNIFLFLNINYTTSKNIHTSNCSFLLSDWSFIQTCSFKLSPEPICELHLRFQHCCPEPAIAAHCSCTLLPQWLRYLISWQIKGSYLSNPRLQAQVYHRIGVLFPSYRSTCTLIVHLWNYMFIYVYMSITL